MSKISALILSMAIYIAILGIIAYLGAKGTKKGAEEYFIGGRSLGTLVLVGTMTATYASLWTFMGAAGGNYRTGITFFSMMMLWNITWPAMIWVLGPRIWLLGRRYRYQTYSELVNDYYNSRVLGIVAGVIGIFAMLPYMAVQLMGAGAALESFSEGSIPYWLGVIIFFVLTILLIAMAGLRAVAYTDTFQAFFFFFALSALSIYAMHLAGGLGTFSKVAAEYPHLLMPPGAMSSGVWLGMVFTWGLCLVIPHMFQRLLMAKKPQVIGRTAIGAAIVSGWVQTLPVFLLGIACNVLMPGITGVTTDSVTVIFANKYTSSIIAAFIVCGAVAAGSSTLNSQLLSLSSIVVKDFLVNPTNQKLSPQAETLYGRLTVLVLGIVIIVIALMRPGLIVPMSTAGTAVCVCGFIYPLIGVLFWHKPGKVAAYGSMITAGVTSVLTWLVWEYPLGIYNIIWGLIVGGIAFVLLSNVGERPSSQRSKEIQALFKAAGA
ncbi:MAG TPA: sodium:solute symporter family protein [Thermosynergistes sp.]|nr:sodium:solute symporter family protein [Thermosynergistes sp.]